MRIDEELLPQKIKFKKHKKRYKGGKVAALSVSESPHGVLYVNTGSIRLIEELGITHVEVFVDSDAGAICLKRSDSPIEGYKITIPNYSGRSRSGSIGVRVQSEVSPGRYYFKPDMSDKDNLIFIFHQRREY